LQPSSRQPATPPSAEVVEKGIVAEIRLSEADLTERAALYNRDGRFGEDLHYFWQVAADDIGVEVRRHWREAILPLAVNSPREQGAFFSADTVINRAAARITATFAGPIDKDWVRSIAQRAYRVRAMGLSLATFTYALHGFYDGLQSLARERFAGEPDRAADIAAAIGRLAIVETEIVGAELAAAERAEAEHYRVATAASFSSRIDAALDLIAAEGRDVQHHLREEASRARDLESTTAEVAAAADQSAIAMNHAAVTVSQLNAAIGGAKDEMAKTAALISEAVDRTASADRLSQSLVEHARDIEGILELIRSVAGATKLLALNATIEAARAGEAGAGFTTVANEVKSLSLKTARATEDIGSRIAAIQGAVDDMVVANAQIRKDVDAAGVRAEATFAVLTNQLATVVAITSSIDETSLAAESIATNISTIRSDYATFAASIGRLEAGFDTVCAQTADLEEASKRFIRDILIG
jgi:methyl-accepting chemotaxis protein